MKEVNKWIGISGSWRLTSQKIENDVRKTVRELILADNGIVTGGALNVDYQATDEVLRLDRPDQIRVYLPASLPIYAAHYRKRAVEGVITIDQAENLIAQLTRLKELNPQGLIEHPTNTEVNRDAYFARNLEVVNASDELIAFQVNNSAGVQDTVEKAREKGIPVRVYTYTI